MNGPDPGDYRARLACSRLKREGEAPLFFSCRHGRVAGGQLVQRKNLIRTWSIAVSDEISDERIAGSFCKFSCDVDHFQRFPFNDVNFDCPPKVTPFQTHVRGSAYPTSGNAPVALWDRPGE